jgi:hypothetical protein
MQRMAGVRGKGRFSAVDQWNSVAGANTCILGTIDVPNFQEDDSENLPGLVLFCGRGILPGEYALSEFACGGIITLDVRSSAFESSDEIDGDEEVGGKTATAGKIFLLRPGANHGPGLLR